jgi:LacI family transcriptional regulator
MKELNYRPNISARSLRTGNTFSIGLVIPSLSDLFFAEVAKGLVQTVRASGYGVLISTAEDDPEIERREIELQLSRQVDALVVASVQESAEFFAALGAQRAPLILVGRKLPSLTTNFVGLRDDEVGYVAAAHLVETGCQKVAYLRGPRTAAADRSWSGYRAALSEFKVPFRPELVVEWGEADRNPYLRGFDAMCRLMAGRARPDGVMCYSDSLALGVIDAALEKKLRVPQDVSVVGCGNVAALRETRVPLTSIDLAGVEVGQRTAKLVLRALSGEKLSPNRSVLVSPHIIVRRSSHV